LGWFFVLLVGTFAGTISGIIGTGSSMILLPVLAIVFGPKVAVPIMAVSAIIANAGRVFVWWSEVRWRAVLWFSLLAVPGAALGAKTLIAIPNTVGNYLLGGLLLLLIPLRYWIRGSKIGSKPVHLLWAGGFIGFFTGVVASSGPLSLAAFSSFGLVKTSLIATEAAASFFVSGAKVTTFRQLGALETQILIHGIIVGGSVVAGTFVAKRLLGKISSNYHDRIIDVTLLVAGLVIILS
jgi:uncharacterized protein